jgi:hypothetical protein
METLTIDDIIKVDKLLADKADWQIRTRWLKKKYKWIK